MTKLLEQRPTGKITKVDSFPPEVDYNEFLFPRLRDVSYSSCYLTSCLNDGENVFFGGLCDVTEAIMASNEDSSKYREFRENNLHRLMTQHNESLNTIVEMLDKLGIQMEFKPKAAV